MVVHYAGVACDMGRVLSIADKYNLVVVEDAAQAIGSKFKGKYAGTFGDIGCFSAHPLKNLNAIGDSGYLVTNNRKVYDLIKSLRNHGMTTRDKVKNFGFVSRMDNLQAGILNMRIKELKKVIIKRIKNAKIYQKHLKNLM